MRLLLTIVVLFLGSFQFSLAASTREDPFIGEWVNWDCGEVMCTLLIAKQPRNYLVTFSAYKFGKANSPLCKVSIKMKRGPLEFNASYHPPDTLSARHGSEPLAYIEPMGAAELFFVTTARCKRHKMGGTFVQEGH